MGEVVVKIKRLYKQYKNGVEANRGIDLEISKGSIFGILGPNGAGKTTLVSQISGLLLPTSGSIEVFGIDVVKYPEKMREIMGMVLQETQLLSHLTVYEHIYYFARLRGLARTLADKGALQLVKEFDLEEYKSTRIDYLSMGLARRTGLATALVGDPAVLILDEPTTGLDPISRRSVWKKLLGLKQKATILLTTHNMEEADYLCDALAIMDQGRIIAQGSPMALKQISSFKFVLSFMTKDTNVHNERKLKDYGRIEVEADRIHVFVKDDTDLDRLMDFLKNKEAAIEISIRKPTLEDAFIELTNRKGRLE